MQINELTLHSTHLAEQKAFYGDLLGFACKTHTHDLVSISTKENVLNFSQAEKQYYYHYAFLIHTGTLVSAIAYLESKGIDLLLFKGEKIVDFGTGRAIYFLDPDGNIAEFIERPSLPYPTQDQFDIDSVIKINEIGHPTAFPAKTAKMLVDKYGIVPHQPERDHDTFQWVGDYNGVFLSVKAGRNWLPLDQPAENNSFQINFTTGKGTFDLTVEAE